MTPPLHRTLGLVFGAADLVIEPSGHVTLLETNQSGEWEWLAVEAAFWLNLQKRYELDLASDVVGVEIKRMIRRRTPVVGVA